MHITGTDLFFLFQIGMAWFFAVPQVIRMTESVEGLTINWLLCANLFIVLNLWLAVGTHKKVRSRATLQALLIYANWTLLLTPMVAIMFRSCPWTDTDTLVALLVMVGVGYVLFGARAWGKPLTDPIIRGLLVGIFRVVPHLYLSYCIVQAKGSGGLAGWTVFSANITAICRIITLIQTGRKDGWESGLKASLLSELANEGSWLLVTGIWFVYR